MAEIFVSAVSRAGVTTYRTDASLIIFSASGCERERQNLDDTPVHSVPNWVSDGRVTFACFDALNLDLTTNYFVRRLSTLNSSRYLWKIWRLHKLWAFLGKSKLLAKSGYRFWDFFWAMVNSFWRRVSFREDDAWVLRGRCIDHIPRIWHPVTLTCS
jgi:hypothetical protein